MTFFQAFVDELDKLGGKGRLMGRASYRWTQTPMGKRGEPMPKPGDISKKAKQPPSKKGEPVLEGATT